MGAGDVAGETLTKDEVCKRIGVTPKVLDGMIRRGQFPHGYKATPKSRPVWPVEVFVAYMTVHPWLLVIDAGAEESDDGEDS